MGQSRTNHSSSATHPSPLWRPRGASRHTHCSTGQCSCAPDLDLTDHLEPDLPAAAEPDHLVLAPEEEGTDTEVEPKSEETDEPLVTEIVNKTATKPRPVVAETRHWRHCKK